MTTLRLAPLVTLVPLDPSLAFETDQARRALRACLATGLGVRLVSTSPPLARGVKVLITRDRLSSDWFSHWQERDRTAVVSLHGWERLSSLPERAMIGYEVLLHGLRAVSSGYAPELFLHDETRGCLFDFCSRKEEVSFKLRAGSLCEPCRRALPEIGISPTGVLSVLETVRALALTTKAPAR